MQSGIRPCLVVSCSKANRHAPIYTVIPGTTKLDKADFPVHFTIEPEQIRGWLKQPTVFLTEQMCPINKNQVIQVAGRVEDEKAIEVMNDMILRQLEIGKI